MNKLINSRVFWPVFIGTLILCALVMVFFIVVPPELCPWFFGFEKPLVHSHDGVGIV